MSRIPQNKQIQDLLIQSANQVVELFDRPSVIMRAEQGIIFGGKCISKPGIALYCMTFGSPDANNIVDEPPNVETHILQISPPEIIDGLSFIQNGKRWNPDDLGSWVWKDGSLLVLQFGLNPKLMGERKITLDEIDSEILVRWLSNHSRAGRNVLCPCGSGLKFKKCCELEESGKGTLVDLPSELSWLHDMELADPDHLDNELHTYIADFRSGRAERDNPNLWFNLGQWLVTKGDPARGLECFQGASRLAPENQDYKMLMVGIMTSMGREDDAISVLDSIPEGAPRRYFYHAQLLKAQGKKAEAIPVFEFAIFEYPDFIPAYRELLNILQEQPENPMYEYWVDQFVLMMPKSPDAAFYYAENRWVERKFEELAEADWFDDLDLTPNDSIAVIGGDVIADHPDYWALRAKLFRDLARCKLNSNSQLLEKMIDGTDDYAQFKNLIDTHRHLCEEGKTLSLMAANDGLTAVIPKAYGLVCEDCTKNKHGITKYVDSILAMAAFQNNDFRQCLTHCETVLTDNPNEDEILPVYGVSLFELAKSDQSLSEKAILALEKLLKLDISDENQVTRVAEESHLFNALGLLNEQFGRLGIANYYYEKLVNIDPENFFVTGHAFLLLIEGRLDDARDELNRQIGILRTKNIRPEFWEKFLASNEPDITDSGTASESPKTIDEYSSSFFQSGWMDEVIEKFKIRNSMSLADIPENQRFEFGQVIISRIVKAKQHVFDELIRYSNENRRSPTLANELIEKNNSFGLLKLGSVTQIRPERYSLQSILDGHNHGNNGLSQQARFLMTLEQAGDFSMIHQSITNESVVFDSLPFAAKTALYEAERRFLSDTPMIDYSMIVIAYAKSLEISLKQIVFEKFREFRNDNNDNLKIIDRRSQAIGLARFLQRGQHLELGGMAHIFKLCEGRTGQKEPIIGELRDFITNVLNGSALLEKTNIDQIARISKDFRNPGAHSEVISKIEAATCREICFAALNGFEHLAIGSDI
jgi:tetratricopeptide (TPR) repeat protein